MASDDLGRRIALQPAGATVPGLDMPGRVEQEDRIVRLGLDQEPQVIRDIAPCRGVAFLASTAHTPPDSSGDAPGELGPQLTACRTSAAILASSAAVTSFSAKEVGHISPSS